MLSDTEIHSTSALVISSVAHMFVFESGILVAHEISHENLIFSVAGGLAIVSKFLYTVLRQLLQHKIIILSRSSCLLMIGNFEEGTL